MPTYYISTNDTEGILEGFRYVMYRIWDYLKLLNWQEYTFSVNNVDGTEPYLIFFNFFFENAGLEALKSTQ